MTTPTDPYVPARRANSARSASSSPSSATTAPTCGNWRAATTPATAMTPPGSTRPSAGPERLGPAVADLLHLRQADDDAERCRRRHVAGFSASLHRLCLRQGLLHRHHPRRRHERRRPAFSGARQHLDKRHVADVRARLRARSIWAATRSVLGRQPGQRRRLSPISTIYQDPGVPRRPTSPAWKQATDDILAGWGDNPPGTLVSARPGRSCATMRTIGRSAMSCRNTPGPMRMVLTTYMTRTSGVVRRAGGPPPPLPRSR